MENPLTIMLEFGSHHLSLRSLKKGGESQFSIFSIFGKHLVEDGRPQSEDAAFGRRRIVRTSRSGRARPNDGELDAFRPLVRIALCFSTMFHLENSEEHCRPLWFRASAMIGVCSVAISLNMEIS
jgi:hypothetical protein